MSNALAAKTANDQSLVPTLTRKNSLELKAPFRRRIESGECGLGETECALRHTSGCWKAMVRQRGLLYQQQRIFDPRIQGYRPITPNEGLWWLINDPRSEFSPNYKKDSITFETFVLRFLHYLKQRGGFDGTAIKEAAKGFDHMQHFTEIGAVAPFEDNSPFPVIEVDGEYKQPEQPAAQSKDPFDEWPEDFPELINDGQVRLPAHGGVHQKDIAQVSRKKAKLTDVVRWVWDNLPVVDFDKKSCPSPAAISMLQWARDDKEKFFCNFVSKLMPTQREIDKEGQLHEKSGQSLPILDQYLDDLANQ